MMQAMQSNKCRLDAAWRAKMACNARLAVSC